MNEAEIHSNMRHDNIVNLRGIFETKDISGLIPLPSNIKPKNFIDSENAMFFFKIYIDIVLTCLTDFNLLSSNDFDSATINKSS